MRENKNKQAFPLLNGDEPKNSVDRVERGLTKREHFAGLALQGILANSEINGSQELDLAAIYENVCDAVKHADALLDKLNEGN